MRAHVTPVLQDCKPIKSLQVRHGDPAGVYRQIVRLRGVIMQAIATFRRAGESWRVSRWRVSCRHPGVPRGELAHALVSQSHGVVHSAPVASSRHASRDHADAVGYPICLVRWV